MVDVDTQARAVTRTFESTSRDGEEVRSQTLAQEYPSPLQDVWEATTTGARIARWFLPVEGELELGGRYQLVGNAGGTVEKCRPPAGGTAGYRITWEFGGGISWVEVALEAIDDDRTRFALTHIAPASGMPPGFWEQYGPGATGVGWDQGLLGLALHLAGDTSVPPEQAEAWALSDEGTTFIRRSADAWAAAHIAGGGDPDAARSAAEGTYAFYTGQG